ncbi:amidohydrolase [Pararhizobium sp. YC-54]|uniref:amidohydrolase family protein n=1 Tax=Pararhizobium sp. YC-54 TaxID=2986920 RepID=UPI0021F6D22F|nr:amidohydrolase [Pararhizobium sp. YC-54]MCW0002117.1 amidohydrolase [Pararhizobium sp. YC-54]
MKTLFRNATILAMDKTHGSSVFAGDLLVSNGRIAAIGPNLTADGARIIDATDKLLMPGLVNAHTHSSETFLRGRYEGMPLEIWLLYAYPLLMGPQVDKRLVYLRSVLLAIESLKSGVTTLCDDFFDPPGHDIERLACAFSAYEDAGIRANISSAVMNIHTLDALPYAREIMPEALKAKLDFGPPMTAHAYMDYCDAVLSSLHGRANGRLRFMVAPSAPQRCTAEMLQACYTLAVRHGIPMHTHVLETKTQAVTGPEFYGKSLVAHLHDLGVLGPNTTIAHSVWVSDADIDLMGEAGCSVAHNGISNLKLGAGVAPIRRLLDAGVHLGLGTDGVSSNDTARILDVMRVAALLQSASGPDFGDWLKADEVLTMATIGGARTAMLDGITGSLETGKAADLLMLDLNGIGFTPLNDIGKHLVYSENGRSIELVMVDGRIVVENDRMTMIDEMEILAEIRERMPAYQAAHAKLERANAIFEPTMAEIHRRATSAEIGFSRYIPSMGEKSLKRR